MICLQDSDCQKPCLGIKREACRCIDNACICTGSVYCSKSCDAECEVDEDCLNGRICDRESCTCYSYPKLEFSFKDCDPNIDPYNQDNLGVKEINWLDQKTLLVKAFVSINCAEKIEDGSFDIEGNKIILKYRSPLCKETCMYCICAHELTYKFINLDKRDYEFELERLF